MSFCGCAIASRRRCSLPIKNRLKTNSHLASPWRRRHRLKIHSHLASPWRRSRTIKCAAWWFGITLAAAGLASRAGAQQLDAEDSAGPAALSSAPAAPAQPPSSTSPKSANGAVYGTVVDSNGGIVSGATVTLSGPISRTVTSDAGGNFGFIKLPAGTFEVKVSASGMSPAQVPNVVLRPGGVRFLPPVVLQVAGASTSIKVYANPEQLAEEQLQLQLHQKVLGFLPNYFSSYDWNAVHLWPKQKFEVSYRSKLDPITFFLVAGEAGVDQFYGRFPGYGSGVQGYAKRYCADYATNFIGAMIGDAILPSLLHQDPRYFYKGTGSGGSRAVYAISRSFIVRGDSGHPQFAFSRILGDLAAGGIANAYYPQENRGVALVFTSAAVDIGANAATNLIREFILPSLTSHMPKGVKQTGPIHF